MINVIENTPLINDVYQYDVILFGMGINNSMNNGFRKDLMINFPYIKEKESETPYGDKRKYGTIKIINEPESKKVFVACYFYKGGNRAHIEPLQVDYEVLKSCLKEVKHWFKDKKIATPILGASDFDGNGDKDVILQIFKEIFNDTNDNITIYDYIQDDYIKRYYYKLMNLKNEYREKKINKITYHEKRSDIEWERLNGIFKKRPIDWEYKRKAYNKQLVKVKKNEYGKN